MEAGTTAVFSMGYLQKNTTEHCSNQRFGMYSSQDDIYILIYANPKSLVTTL